MKGLAAVALLASSAVALPFAKRAANVTDIDILNYALTLEYLEDNFYSTALQKYSNEDFVKAGLPTWARGRFQQVAQHEATHVATLAGALGNQATQACKYSFPYTDPASFAALSSVLEGVGVSAYLGAAALIQDPTYLTVAGSILTTEARHQAWVTSAANKAQPWSGAFDTPLTLDQIYTLAAGFITSCPSSNPALPVSAFPALTANSAKPGQSITYSFSSNSSGPFYAAIYQGLATTVLPLSNKKATLPSGLQGTYYTIITTSSNATQISGTNTVAGPLISVVDFPSSASQATSA